MHVSNLGISLLLSSYGYFYGVVFRTATLLVATVALVACVTYLRAYFVASVRALRTCVASDVYTLSCVAYVAYTWAGNGAVEVACVDSRPVW